MTPRLNTAASHISEREYNRVFVVEDRKHWNTCSMHYNPGTDLVLTMDLGLLKLIEKQKGTVHFVDNLLDREDAEKLNYELHDFFHKWYFDKNGNDPFAYKGISVSGAFLLNIVNDVSYNYHFFINLAMLKHFRGSEMICAVSDEVVRQWIGRLYPAARFTETTAKETEQPTYYFPVSKWMTSKVETDSLPRKMRRWGVGIIETLKSARDFLLPDHRPAVFIQNYYPTNPIIEHFKQRDEVKLILASYTDLKNAVKERRVLYNNKKVRDGSVEASLQKLGTINRRELMIDGFDIAPALYDSIITLLPDLLQKAYSRLESIAKYFRKSDLRLMVPVTELWLENKLLINYCRHNRIPVFLITNGILYNNYAYDGKDVEWVNCYGEAIRLDYFQGRENAVCLGDPRMDYYSTQQQKTVNRQSPIIIIGAGAYNMTDMNSYLAYEFDFLYDLLDVLDELKREGYRHQVVLKVRENGYVSQYNSFLSEYFPQLNVRVERELPFKTVIREADFYITFYSQTLLEAAMLGIPALYYKKDQHIINRPFDGYSEVVTAFSKKELKDAIYAFYKTDNRYNKFMDKKVLEKYIGFLDGKNLQRNIDFINSFLRKEKSGELP